MAACHKFVAYHFPKMTHHLLPPLTGQLNTLHQFRKHLQVCLHAYPRKPSSFNGCQFFMMNYCDSFSFQCTQTGTVAVFPVGPSRTTQPNTSTAPTLSTLPPNTSPSSGQPPIPLIIGAVIIGLVVLTLLLLGLVLLLKYHQLGLGKRRTHLDNPTYEGERRGSRSLRQCEVVNRVARVRP